MTPLRQAMIKAMQMRGFAERTHQSYLAAVTVLARYTRRSPDHQRLRSRPPSSPTWTTLKPSTSQTDASASGIAVALSTRDGG